MQLEHHGDVDTWRGPRPDLCRATLATNQQQLHRAVDDLREHAIWFDRRASDLDAIARMRVDLAV